MCLSDSVSVQSPDGQWVRIGSYGDETTASRFCLSGHPHRHVVQIQLQLVQHVLETAVPHATSGLKLSN